MSKKDDCCPRCGYCKHCGRGPRRYHYQPYYTGDPPTAPGYTTWVTGNDIKLTETSGAVSYPVTMPSGFGYAKDATTNFVRKLTA